MAEEGARLAELTIAISLATDLGTGQPMDQALRTCWLSLGVADALTLDTPARSCVYHVALLRFVGCTSDASEVAVMAGGDDITFNAVMAPIVNATPAEAMSHFVRHLAEDIPLHRRVGRVVVALTDLGMEHRSSSGHCEVAARLARRLGLDATVCHSLAHAFERWDGRGHPAGLAGDDVPVAVRIVAAARDAEVLARRAGWPAAVEVLRRRRDRGYDPAVVDALVADGERWLGEVTDDPCGQVLDAEPAPVATLAPDGVDRALKAIADFADLKSPFFRTHSGGVARLAATAARAAGMSDAAAAEVRRASLVHDVGRVGVPGGIWDRRGALTADQWERVRLHPYLSERVLRRCSLLSSCAEIASRHHERVDGSGYHRGIAGDEIAVSARLLAAADAYHAMTEERPHRPARTPDDAAAVLLDEAADGRFRPSDVDAVLEAAGHQRHAAGTPRPAGLTDREVEVLRLIARGHANKQVATMLGISPKTVGRHVEHIYAKADVSTRAGATLFAMEHDLLAP